MSLKEVKIRINATKKTKQITKAMGMVSSSKLHKLEQTQKKYQEFVLALNDIVVNVLLSLDSFEEHPLLKQRELKKTAYFLITSDRGLAGSYNSSLFKDFEQYCSKNHQSSDEYVIRTIGKIGYNYFKKKQLSDQAEMIHNHDDIMFSEIEPLATKIINLFYEDKIDKFVVVYKHFVNTLTQETVFKQVLPIRNISGRKQKREYYYESGLDMTIDLVLPMYVRDILYSYILDAKASEHACRMNSMRSATKNADEITDKLRLLYNRSRQEAITNELIDIIGGSEALRKE